MQVKDHASAKCGFCIQQTKEQGTVFVAKSRRLDLQQSLDFLESRELRTLDEFTEKIPDLESNGLLRVRVLLEYEDVTVKLSGEKTLVCVRVMFWFVGLRCLHSDVLAVLGILKFCTRRLLR